MVSSDDSYACFCQVRFIDLGSKDLTLDGYIHSIRMQLVTMQRRQVYIGVGTVLVHVHRLIEEITRNSSG